MTISISTESGNGERNCGTTTAASNSPKKTSAFVLDTPDRKMLVMRTT